LAHACRCPGAARLDVPTPASRLAAANTPFAVWRRSAGLGSISSGGPTVGLRTGSPARDRPDGAVPTTSDRTRNHAPHAPPLPPAPLRRPRDRPGAMDLRGRGG